MKLNWINLCGGLIFIFIMIPNIIYSYKTKNQKIDESFIPEYLQILEQIGRYGCIILMCLPIGIAEFGFKSVEEMIAYLLLNMLLLLSYYIIWVIYMKRKTFYGGMALAAIPVGIFLLSGYLLHHYILVLFAFIFGATHLRITYFTHQQYRGGQV